MNNRELQIDHLKQSWQENSCSNNIQFKESSYVYVASSDSENLVEIGVTENPKNREIQLNSYCYGGVNDWNIQLQIFCDYSGRVEFHAQESLLKYIIGRESTNQDSIESSQELYDCDVSVAISAINSAIEEIT